MRVHDAVRSLAGVVVAGLVFPACTDARVAPVAPATTAVICCGELLEYTAAELALPTGTWANAAATAINDSGLVVGWVESNGFSRPVAWATSGTPSFLVTYSPDYSTAATGINSRGDMVGWANYQTATVTGTWRAVRWASGLFSFLPSLGYDAYAFDINTSRVAVGASRAGPSLPVHAVKWTSSGAIVDLHPGVAIASRAFGVNDAGDVVGTAQFADGFHAWLWRSDGTQRDLRGSPAEGAQDINDSREIIGTIFSIFDGNKAMSWNYSGDLIPLDGAFEPSFGFGVSNGHRFVGFEVVTAGIRRAWTIRGSSSTSLPLLATWVGGAVPADVNRCGRAVGSAITAAGTRPALWRRRICDP